MKPPLSAGLLALIACDTSPGPWDQSRRAYCGRMESIYVTSGLGNGLTAAASHLDAYVFG